MKKTLLILIISLLAINITIAQSSFNAAGGDVENSDIKVSWSIGQTFYQADENIIEGVQQPYEISTVINSKKAISLNLVVYPNPTPDFLELRIDEMDFDLKSSSYRVVDINGNVLITEKINNFITQISMGNYPKGVYLLEVNIENNTVKSFKIVKN